MRSKLQLVIGGLVSTFEFHFFEVHGAGTMPILDNQGRRIEPFEVKAETEDVARGKARAEISQRLPKGDPLRSLDNPRYELVIWSVVE